MSQDMWRVPGGVIWTVKPLRDRLRTKKAVHVATSYLGLPTMKWGTLYTHLLCWR
jgi:hypothetical protein